MTLKLVAFSGSPGLLILVCALVPMAAGDAYSQEKSFAQDTAHARQCSQPGPQTSGTHRFRQQEESFDIVLNDAAPGNSDSVSAGRQISCQAIALELRWSNGRNNGSNFHVTFLDSDNQPIYTKEISAFMTGSFQFPFAMLEPQLWHGAGSLISVPSTVTIQAVRPFAFPASISYTVTRVALEKRAAVNQENLPQLKADKIDPSERMNRTEHQELRKEPTDQAYGKARAVASRSNQ
jgi:hypothetical protein